MYRKYNNLLGIPIRFKHNKNENIKQKKIKYFKKIDTVHDCMIMCKNTKI